MKYLGSSGGKCYTGFDQTAYVEAVSSNVFNGVSTDVFDVLVAAYNATNPSAGTGSLSARIPNPFYHVNSGVYIDSAEPILSLADGGTDGQQIPFQPLLVKARGVDVVIAVDMVRLAYDPCVSVRLRRNRPPMATMVILLEGA